MSKHQPPELPTIPDHAYPPYAQTPDERERWRLSIGIAQQISAANEPTGEANTQFVWYFARTVYFSAIPTGDRSDAILTHHD